MTRYYVVVLLFKLVQSAQKKNKTVSERSFSLQKSAAKKLHNTVPSEILIKKAVTITMYHLLGYFVYRTWGLCIWYPGKWKTTGTELTSMVTNLGWLVGRQTRYMGSKTAFKEMGCSASNCGRERTMHMYHYSDLQTRKGNCYCV